MSLSSILIVVLFVVVYFLLCYYISYNGWVWLKTSWLKGRFKKSYILIMMFLSFSLFFGQVFSGSFFEWIGGFWMAIMGYSLILLPFVNLIVYLLKKRGIFWIGVGVISFFVIIFMVGSFNAWNPIVRNYEVTIPQTVEQPNLKILMASDLHLGPIVGESHLQKLIEIADEVEPDVILLAGDIIDDHIEPFLEHNMGGMMKKLNAPLGVYAISGNHDVYGNDLPQLVHEMERAGIRVLRDEAVLINDQFYIVGRKDLAEGNRKEIHLLVRELEKTKPVIMLDHQPTELDEAEKTGVDLLLSGHTHKGQLAPANLITGMLFENDGGYLRKEALHSFVSSGLGTWGPPLRIGSRSEVMVINLNFGER
jgi:uncharacterized protein